MSLPLVYVPWESLYSMYCIVTMLVFLVVEMNPYNLTGQCPPPRGDNLEKLSTVVIILLLISQKLSLEMKRKLFVYLFCLFHSYLCPCPRIIIQRSYSVLEDSWLQVSRVCIFRSWVISYFLGQLYWIAELTGSLTIFRGVQLSQLECI